MIVNMGNAEYRNRYSGGGYRIAAYSPLFMARCCCINERDRVKGVIINTRGDVALLYSGIEQIESLPSWFSILLAVI